MNLKTQPGQLPGQIIQPRPGGFDHLPKEGLVVQGRLGPGQGGRGDVEGLADPVHVVGHAFGHDPVA